MRAGQRPKKGRYPVVHRGEFVYNLKGHAVELHSSAPANKAMRDFVVIFVLAIPCLQKQLIPAKAILCENDSYFKIQVFSIRKHIYCGFFMLNFSNFLQLV